MFLGRYLKASFQFDKLLTHFNEKFYKVFLYFIFLSLMYLLPMNFLIIRETGWRIDFIYQDFLVETPTWDLPSDCRIELNQLFCTTDSKTIETHEDVTYIFNGTETDLDTSKKQVILTNTYIIYSDGLGHYMNSSGYEGFDSVNFNSINILQGNERSLAYLDFASHIESSFGPYIVLYSILTNTAVNIFIQFLFIVMLGLVLQLFRFGYQQFFSYIDGLKFIMLAMGLPTLVGILIGLIHPAFGSVFFQLTMGLTVMIVMLKYGKKTIK